MHQNEYIGKVARAFCDEIMEIHNVQSVITLVTYLEPQGETMITWTGRGNSAANYGAMHAYMQNQKLKTSP